MLQRKKCCNIFLGETSMTTMTKVAHFTCDVCDVIRDGAVKFSKWFWRVSTDLGYARAAAEMTRLGRHEEAKQLMLERHK